MDRWITDWERGEPDGALITVDGTAGTVTVMTPSAGDRAAAS